MNFKINFIYSLIYANIGKNGISRENASRMLTILNRANRFTANRLLEDLIRENAEHYVTQFCWDKSNPIVVSYEEYFFDLLVKEMK
jgi:hypothetical protein